MRTQLVYKLDGINPEDGVDIYQIAPVLMQFGDLIKSASSELDLDLDIDVRVKPFREGSWITDFVLHGTFAANVLNYLNSPEGRDIALLMAFLGLGAKDGIVGLAHVVRFTRGVVSKFRRNTNDTVTYIGPDDSEITVSMAEHTLIQSPLIQVNYYNSMIAPLDRFPTATAVVIGEGESETQRFTSADKPAFDEYRNAELAESIVEESTTSMSGVFLKPKRGPYSGDEQSFSFIMGDTVLWPVAIEDDELLAKLRSGEIRPYSEDVLRVDLELRQKKDSRNKITTHYAIVRLLEYHKFERPHQLSLGDDSSD